MEDNVLGDPFGHETEARGIYFLPNLLWYRGHRRCMRKDLAMGAF